MTSPTAPSDPNLKPPPAGGSNWDLGDSSVRNRLTEDITTLQANLDALPLSPEVTATRRKLVNLAIQFGKSLIRPTGVLQPDGLNFGKWFANLEEIGRMVMENQFFFFFFCSNSTYEKIGRAVILASIHESLVAEILAIPACFLMYGRLMMKFNSPSRAAQMYIWYKFWSFKIDPNRHNAGIASALQDLHSEWITINVVFTIDSFLGFVLQVSVVDSGAPY
ncbi:hypothetical protein PSHT_10548 [Puccinia striiformis]|uniref:Uncharacterized protein n=2 Tax=Puccinia striiformis TaxID=27350 RepID=A0A2S4V8Z2_9BASI|nr:hypothetical protein PSHT_10548 [Puccinia striiformis]POW09043.1 hypothetical protein PSTT_07087 [Puccinia striiformis]